MTRRGFLTGTVKAVIAAVITGVGAVAAYFMYPAGMRARQPVYCECMEEEALPKKGVKRAEYRFEIKGRQMTASVYIVRHDGGLYALSPVCSHLGCIVNYNRHKNEFICPCHGGKYDEGGNVIAGPPPAPLSRLPLKVEQGRVYIGVMLPQTAAAA
ncbi:MAG: Rieske 2Fe-2S domain-containing protein [Candidatus Magnetominusculus sp. LBB02]|nr:Rieske 2Fe-2S domain-containing protein [Candidatus Magnetominusculus sp. LBB02]